MFDGKAPTQRKTEINFTSKICEPYSNTSIPQYAGIIASDRHLLAIDQ